MGRQEQQIEGNYFQYHKERIHHIDYFRPFDFENECIEGLRNLANKRRDFVYHSVTAFAALLFSIRVKPGAVNHANWIYH